MSFESSRPGLIVSSLCGLWMLLCLQGCASTGQVREQEAATAVAAQSQEDDAKCKVNGAPDTPSYQQCREKLVEKRMQEAAAQEVQGRQGVLRRPRSL